MNSEKNSVLWCANCLVMSTRPRITFDDRGWCNPCCWNETAGVHSSFWMFTLLVTREDFGRNTRDLLGVLAGEKIPSLPLWQPLYFSPAHRDCLVLGGEVSERLYRNGLSMPCSVGLSGENKERVIGLVKAFAK